MKRCDIGGQAVLEGVMMKAPDCVALAVREPSGNIALEIEKTDPPRKTGFVAWPVVRGVYNFGKIIALGVKTLTRSAQLAGFEDEVPKEGPLKFWEKDEFILGAGVAGGLLLTVGLFFLLPSWAVSLFMPIIEGGFWLNLIEAGIRLLIFIGYMVLVSYVKDIKRVFMYHGAEHKTIACYEKELPLTVENARSCSPYHPRCGTSFLVLVMLVSILVFAPFGRIESVLLRMSIRLLAIPLIAGISYELLKGFAYQENVLAKIIRAPGLWLQRITALEPTDDMLEVSICAFEGALGIRQPVQAVEELFPQEFLETPIAEPPVVDTFEEKL